MQNIFAFLEAPLFTLWKSCLKALKFLSDSHSAFLGRKTRMTQLVSILPWKCCFCYVPKANWKEYPFYEKSCIFVVVKAWKISAAQIMRAEKFRLSNFGCGKVSISCMNIYPCNFDELQFWSPLRYRDVLYIFGNLQSISKWSQLVRTIAALWIPENPFPR